MVVDVDEEDFQQVEIVDVMYLTERLGEKQECENSVSLSIRRNLSDNSIPETCLALGRNLENHYVTAG